MMRILFVDDEIMVLRGLQRALCDLKDEWEVTFVGSGEEALALLAQGPIDVLITDMHMPGMTGAQLLAEAKRLYPRTVRIVLSGTSDKDQVLQALGSTHQFLTKPCEFEQLYDVITRSCELRKFLAEENLRQLVSRTQTLPSLPRLYTEVMDEIENPRGSIRKVAEIISRDIGMTSRILHILNSAFFGLPRKVSDISMAVTLLGFDTVRALILATHVFAQLDRDSTRQLNLDNLWNHSLAVSTSAKCIASFEKCDAHGCDHALMAGLLHDTGKLVLALGLPDRYREMLKLSEAGSITPLEAETRVFGSTHAEVGAYLFGLWGLPDAIVEAVAFHHHPAKCVATGFTPLAAVYAADMMVNERGDCATGCGGAPSVDMAWLDRLGLADRLPAWRNALSADSHAGAVS